MGGKPMSLMGYTEQEVKDVIEDLYNAKDQTSKEFKESVQIAIDILDGLLVEGRL